MNSVGQMLGARLFCAEYCCVKNTAVEIALNELDERLHAVEFKADVIAVTLDVFVLQTPCFHRGL